MESYRDLLERSKQVRSFVLGALLFWMLLGPVVSQLIIPKSRWFRSWTMYSGVGRGLRDVQFFVVRDGALEPVNWPSLPERPGGYVPRGPLRRSIRNDEDFQWVTTTICGELGAGGDLRAVVSEGFNEGWKPLMNRERNLCEESANDQ